MQSATEFLLKMRLVERETSFPADIVKHGGGTKLQTCSYILRTDLLYVYKNAWICWKT